MSSTLASELAPLLAAARRLPQLVRFGWQLLGELNGPMPSSQAERVLALHELSQRMTEAHGLKPRVQGSVPQGPCILVANHLSYLDPLILCSLLPCAPIAKQEVRHWPVVGTLAARYATTFVRRNDPHSGAIALRRSLSLLESGISVLNFPEGTTTTGRLRPFHRGIFGLAQLARVPVVPITVWFADRWLCWVDDALLLPHYLKLLRSGNLSINVEVGVPIQADRLSAADLAKAAQGSIQRQLHAAWPDTACPIVEDSNH